MSDESEFWQALGRRLRKHREARGLSQQTVAEKLRLPRPAVSDMERGTRKVYALELGDLATMYGTTADALLSGIGPDLNTYADECHRANRRWWQDPVTGEPVERNDGELFALFHSEVSEACSQGTSRCVRVAW
jgi:transcriptional regulator with XRE-family HTH domain